MRFKETININPGVMSPGFQTTQKFTFNQMSHPSQFLVE